MVMALSNSIVTSTVDRQPERANHYQRLQRMEKSPRHQWSAWLLIFTVVLTVAEGAPSTTTVTLPAPPTADSSTDMLNDSPVQETQRTPPEPTGYRITFFKNSQCTLHKEGERGSEIQTESVVCGLRELDLPAGAGSGVRFWTPARCQRYNCQCIATREEHRQKRTMSDNKMDIVYKRYRVFECI